MYLKQYQIKVIRELTAFFEKCRDEKAKVEQIRNQVSDDQKEIVSRFNYVESAFGKSMKKFVDNPENGLGNRYPRFCIKIPTGGGKTLIAVEAIREYQNIIARKKNGLVVWIVPSETIYSQTVKKLRDKSNPLRQLLDQASGNRTVILEKGQKLTNNDLEENLVVLFIMIQSVSRKNAKESLKVFQDSGGYESFFPDDNRFDLHSQLLERFPNLDAVGDAQDFQPQIKTSLGNAIRVSSPLILIDEIHKVFSDQAKKTIDNLNPEMVIGLSATPKDNMNVLVSITGLELKNEEMVKLDLHVIPPGSTRDNGWKDMIRELRSRRDDLEEIAKRYKGNTGVYIRPIALLQVEATGKDQRGRGRVHSFDAKEQLMAIGVPEHEIAIKTSSQNDIEDVDLFSSDCEIRYIITKEALREGWDCSFAYVLGIIPNANSNTGVTQLVGRILRQPFARKTKIPELDESYVYYFRGNSREVLNRVIAGFKNEGLQDLAQSIKLTDNNEVHPSKKVGIKDHFKNKYGNTFFLPVWLIVESEDKKRRFNYSIDIKSRLDYQSYKPDKAFIENIIGAFSEETIERKGFAVSIDSESKATFKEETEEVNRREELNLSYFTRRINELVDNPFLSRLVVNNIIAELEKELDEEQLKNHFSFIVAQVFKDVEQFKEKQENEIFLKLIEDNVLVLAVADKENEGFEIPEEEYITVSSIPSTYKYYLFDDVELDTMNNFEKTVGDMLEKQEKILWWFRNKVKKDWYSIDGWKNKKMYPDFVAAKKTDEDKVEVVYILESKGEQLAGNKDTEYKKDLMDLMTRQKNTKGIAKYQQLELPFGTVNDNLEFYLFEQGEEEKEIKKLYK